MSHSVNPNPSADRFYLVQGTKNGVDGQPQEKRSFVIKTKIEITDEHLKHIAKNILIISKSQDNQVIEIESFHEDGSLLKIKELGGKFRDIALLIESAVSSWCVEIKQRDDEYNALGDGPKVKEVTFSTLHKKVLKKWAIKNSVASFLARWIIAPLVALHQYRLHKGKSLETIKKEQTLKAFKSLRKKLDPETPKSFRKLLERTLDKFSVSGVSEDPLIRLLKSAVETGKSLEENKSGTVLNFANRIFTGDHLSIPTGFYVNGKFNPVLLTFNQLSNGKILVQQNTFARTQGDFPRESKYTIDIKNSQDLSKFIENILSLGQAPAPAEKGAALSEKETKSNARLQEKRGLVSAPDSTAQEADSMRRVKDPLGSLMTTLGATLSSDSVLDQEKDEGGLGFIDRFLSGQEGIQGVQYTMSFLSDEISLFFDASAEFNEDENIQSLQFLGKQIETFEKKITKHFGSVDLFWNYYQGVDSVTEFKTAIDRVKEAIQTAVKQPAIQLEKALREEMKVSESTSIAASIPVTAMRVSESKVDLERGLSAVESKRLELNTLKEAFTTSNEPLAFQTLKELNKVTNSLVEQKRYAEAMELADAIQSLLPTPTVDGKEGGAFWSVFKTGEIQDRLAKLGEWEKQINDIAKYGWESFVHLDKKCLEPEQMIHAMNTRAVIMKIIRLKSLTVKDKMLAFYVSKEFEEDSKDIYQQIIQAFNDNPTTEETISNLKKFGIYSDQEAKLLNAEEKLLLVTYEEATTVLFDDYGTDHQQFQDILDKHDHIRFSSVAMGDKVLAIQKYLKGKDEWVVRSGKLESKPIRLDTQIDTPPSIETNEKEYRNKIRYMKFLYQGKLSDFEKPKEMTSLSKHTAMFQMMYRSGYSKALSFSGLFGGLGALAWVKQTKEAATAIVGQDQEAVMEKSGEIAYGEVAAITKTMGRLELKDDLLLGFPTFNMVDRNNPTKKIAYIPWGLGGFGEEAKKMLAFLHPDHGNAASFASTDPEWSKTVLSQKHQELVPGTLDGKSVNAREQTVITELGAFLACSEKGGDVNEAFMLRTLESVDLYRETYSYKTLENAKEALTFLVGVRPDLLEDVRVQRRLELILTRTHTIQRLLRAEPEFLIGFAPVLKALIESKMRAGKQGSACFLMHLGSLFKSHGEAAFSSLEEFSLKDPYVHEFGKTDKVIPYIGGKEQGLSLKLKEITVDISTFNFIVPCFETTYSWNPDAEEMSGIDKLKEIAVSKKGNQLAARVLIIEYLMNKYPADFEKSDFESLEIDEIKFLIEGRSSLLYASQEVGLPMNNIAMLHWLEQKFFPVLKEKMDEGVVKGNNAIINALVRSQGQQVPEGNWTLKPGTLDVFTCGNLEMTLRSQLLKVDGQFVERVKQRSAVPADLIAGSSVYQRFFGNQPRLANVTLGEKNGDCDYEFNEGSQEFKVRYNRIDETSVIFQKRGDTWYRFQECEGKGQGMSHVLGTYGVWLNNRDPKKAICIPSENGQSADVDCFDVTFDGQGFVEKMTPRSQESMLVCPDGDGSLSELLHVSHPNHVVFLRKTGELAVSEIRFLNMGISLTKVERKWKTQEGYEWLPREQIPVDLPSTKRADLFQNSLGADFSEIALRLTKNEGKEQAFMVFPHRVLSERLPFGFALSFEKEEASINGVKKKPFLITIDKHGEMETSAAGYLYLASVFAAKQDHEKALHYLLKAESGTLLNPEQVNAFDFIMRLLETNNPQSLLELTFQLKAELTIRKLKVNLLNIPLFDPAKKGPYFKELHRISDLFVAYQKKSALQIGERSEEFKLTSEEQSELDHIGLEGMDFLSRAESERKAHPSTPLTMSAIQPSAMDREFMIAIFNAAQDPIKGEFSIKDHPKPLTSKHILYHFMNYYHAIVQGEISLDNLTFLFASLEDKEGLKADSEEAKNIGYADKARRILIQIAHYRQNHPQEKLPPINVQEILKQRASIPTSDSVLTLPFRVLARKFGTGESLSMAGNALMTYTDLQEGVKAIQDSIGQSVTLSSSWLTSNGHAVLGIRKTLPKSKDLGEDGVSTKRVVEVKALIRGVKEAKQNGLLSAFEENVLNEVTSSLETATRENQTRSAEKLSKACLKLSSMLSFINQETFNKRFGEELEGIAKKRKAEGSSLDVPKPLPFNEVEFKGYIQALVDTNQNDVLLSLIKVFGLERTSMETINENTARLLEKYQSGEDYSLASSYYSLLNEMKECLGLYVTEKSRILFESLKEDFPEKKPEAELDPNLSFEKITPQQENTIRFNECLRILRENAQSPVVNCFMGIQTILLSIKHQDLSSNLEILEVAKACASDVEKELSMVEIPVELEFALEQIHLKSGISLIDLRRETELSARADALTRLVKAEVPKIDLASSVNPTIQLKSVAMSIDLDDFFNPADRTRQVSLETTNARILELFKDDENLTAIQRKENENMRASLRSSGDKAFLAEENRRTLKQGSTDDLSARMTLVKESAEKDCQRLFTEIKTLALKEPINDPVLKKMSSQPSLYSEQEVFKYILSRYQSIDRDKALFNRELDGKITTFLIDATAVQQIDQGFGKIEKLKKLLEYLPLTKAAQKQWDEESRILYELLDRGLKIDRYLKSPDNESPDNRVLKNPQYTRKYLVAEYLSERILRDGQIEKIESLAENPEQWLSLRMGLGKTSYIMPIVAAILAEKKQLPILLGPTSLNAMNQADFDKTTRKLYGTAAHSLRITESTCESAATLAEVYCHMLSVYKEGGYFVTTVESMAQLKNGSVDLAEERHQFIEQIEKLDMRIKELKRDTEGKLIDSKELQAKKNELESKEEELKKIGLFLINNDKRLHWLNKIESLLDAKKTNPSVIFLADEVDSIQSIRKEMNKAHGKTEKVSEVIQSCSRLVFDVILGADEQSSEELQAFKNQILNVQSPVPSEKVEAYLRAAAEKVIEHPAFQQKIGGLFSKVNKEQFIDYLLGKRTTYPEGMPGYDTEEEKKLGIDHDTIDAMKGLFYPTLSGMLSQVPGHSYVFSNEDGAMIIPASQGTQEKGSRFGDPFRLIAIQYLGWIQMEKSQNKEGDAQGKSSVVTAKEFMTKSLSSLQEIKPIFYKEMVIATGLATEQTFATTEIDLKTLATKLMEPKHYQFRLQILDSEVFGKNLISRTAEQTVLSVQSALANRRVGGVSGTLNLCELDRFDPTRPALRDVEVETMRQAVMLKKEGVDTLVNHITEETLRAIIHCDENTAIINEAGYGMTGKDTYAWVKGLRMLSPEGSERPFMFISPTTRKPQILLPGEDTATEFIVGMKVPDRCICVYAPEDSRGTDLPIPAGKMAYFPLPSTNSQDSSQSMWRGRGLGTIHDIDFYLPLDDENQMTIGQFFVQASRESVKIQAPDNLKKQSANAKEVEMTNARNVLFSPALEKDNPQYYSDVESAIKRMMVEDKLWKVYRPLFIQGTAPDLKALHAPSSKEASTTGILADYEQAKVSAKTRRLKLVDELMEMKKKADQAEKESKKLSPPKVEPIASQNAEINAAESRPISEPQPQPQRESPSVAASAALLPAFDVDVPVDARKSQLGPQPTPISQASFVKRVVTRRFQPSEHVVDFRGETLHVYQPQLKRENVEIDRKDPDYQEKTLMEAILTGYDPLAAGTIEVRSLAAITNALDAQENNAFDQATEAIWNEEFRSLYSGKPEFNFELRKMVNQAIKKEKEDKEKGIIDKKDYMKEIFIETIAQRRKDKLLEGVKNTKFIGGLAETRIGPVLASVAGWLKGVPTDKKLRTNLDKKFQEKNEVSPGQGEGLAVSETGAKKMEELKDGIAKLNSFNESLTSDEFRPYLPIIGQFAESYHRIGFQTEDELTIKRAEFEANQLEFAKFLPKERDRSAAAIGGNSQVQQQQQQQQQTILRESNRQISPPKRLENPSASHEFALWESAEFFSGGIQDPKTEPFACDLGVEGVSITPEALRLIREIRLSGDFAIHFGIKEDGNVLLMTRQDYQIVVQPRWDDQKVSILTPISQGLVLHATKSDSDPLKDSKIFLKALQLKYLLGFDQFSEEETTQLKAWRSGLSLAQVDHIKTWRAMHSMAPKDPLLG